MISIHRRFGEPVLKNQLFKHDLMNGYIKRVNYAHLLLALVIFFLLAIIIARIHATHRLEHITHRLALPLVITLTAKAQQNSENIVLPGNVQPWHEATIYARTSGYLQQWYVDIGSKVKKDQLLALIKTPELDAQLMQAEATLANTVARNNLAQITAKRWLNLLKTQSVSTQEAEEKVSSAKALAAAVDAAAANVQRLKELASFERVIAPFSGVITARHTDLGDLINTGNNTSAKPLFRIAQLTPLRIYVKVPQAYSAKIKPKMQVLLSFIEHPGQLFKAQLLNTADAIDPKTHTLLTQFIVDNQQGQLLAGGYTSVSLTLALAVNRIHLPVNTLLFQAKGAAVATVTPQNIVQLKSIDISRDFGTTIEINGGIKPGEKIIINPSDGLSTGDKVRVKPDANP